jgi:hypothetical protein
MKYFCSDSNNRCIHSFFARLSRVGSCLWYSPPHTFWGPVHKGITTSSIHHHRKRWCWSWTTMYLGYTGDGWRARRELCLEGYVRFRWNLVRYCTIPPWIDVVQESPSFVHAYTHHSFNHDHSLWIREIAVTEGIAPSRLLTLDLFSDQNTGMCLKRVFSVTVRLGSVRVDDRSLQAIGVIWATSKLLRCQPTHAFSGGTREPSVTRMQWRHNWLFDFDAPCDTSASSINALGTPRSVVRLYFFALFSREPILEIAFRQNKIPLRAAAVPFTVSH